MARGELCYLDRFEGGTAVLLWKNIEFIVPREMLPDDAREGDMLTMAFTRNEKAKDDTAADISALQKRLEGEKGK